MTKTKMSNPCKRQGHRFNAVQVYQEGWGSAGGWGGAGLGSDGTTADKPNIKAKREGVCKPTPLEKKKFQLLEKEV